LFNSCSRKRDAATLGVEKFLPEASARGSADFFDAPEVVDLGGMRFGRGGSRTIPSLPFLSYPISDERSSIIRRAIWWSGVFWLLAAINFLMMPTRDLQKLFPINLILEQQPIRRQFVDHSSNGFDINVISRENLSLDAFRRKWHSPVIVGEIPHSDEHETSVRRAFDDLLTRPELGFDGADPCHQAASPM
jgi:hypothetical protein